MSAATASLPTRIGRFQVRARLGAGAFAEVYRAHDPQLARDVAVKVVRDGVLGDATAVQRFLREGKVAARLCHPHIVSVFDAGQDGGRYYLAASFIDGQTLAQRLQGDPFEVRAAAVLVRDLAEALQHAHKMGVIHRDVKPANILLDAHGSAHLADFGLAHVGESLEKLTQDGTVLGSPAYMAPELAAGGAAPPLPASDQYSLGVVLYELLCGRAPFEGAPAKVLHDAIHTPPQPPRQVKSAVPLDLETICLKAMAKRSEDRYADCKALADDLRRWLEGEPIRARRLSLVERLARWFKREPKVAWTSLGAACCLLFAALTPLLASVLLGAVQSQEQKEREHLETVTRNAVLKAADADEQRRRAESATVQAKTATKEAKQQQELLKQASARLPEERRKQDEALARLEQDQRQRRHAQYAADIHLAFQELGDQNLYKMLELLKRHQPQPGQEDLRGFEWYYLVEQTRLRPITSTLVGQQAGAISVLHFKGESSALMAVSHTDHGVGNELKTDFQFRYYEGKSAPARGYTLTGVGRNTPVLISPDGRLVVVKGDSIASSRVINTETGAVLGKLEKHKRPFTQCSFSQDGTWLATVDDSESEVRIWDLRTYQEVATIAVPGFPRPILSHDGKTLATALGNGKVQLWDIATRKELPLAIDALRDWAGVAFTPNDKVLVVRSGKALTLWNLLDRKSRDLPEASRAMRFVVSPDSKLLAVLSSEDKQTKCCLSIWDIATGSQLATNTGVDFGRNLLLNGADCVFSPDSRLLAAIGQEKEEGVYIFEAATLRLRVHLPLPNAASLAFSTKGDFLAAAGRNGQIAMWKWTQFEGAASLSGLNASLPALVVMPQGETIAVSQGKTIELLDRKTGFRLAVFPVQSDAITCLATAAQGETLATGARDGVVKLWNVTTRKEEKELSGPGSPIRSLVVSANGQIIAAGRENGSLTLWDCATGKLLAAPLPQKEPVRALALSHDGNLLAWTADENTVKLWNVREKTAVGVLTGHKAPVTALAIAPDDKTLVTGGDDKTLKLWDLATRKERITLGGRLAPVERLLFTPDGKTIVSTDHMTIALWEATTGLELGTMQRLDHSVEALAFAPQGNMLVSASKNGTLDYWAADNGDPQLPDVAPPPDSLRATLRATLQGHTNQLRAVAFAADGKTLASASMDQTIKLWDVGTGQERATLKGHTGSVDGVAFPADGQALASASGDKTVKLWTLSNTATGKEEVTLKGGHTSGVLSVAFSPDGKTLASASADGALVLWDLAMGKERATFQGDKALVISVVFSPDGKTLASWNRDNTIKLWDVALGKERVKLVGHTNLVISVAFSPDGKTLASVSLDKTIKLWDLATGTEQSSLKGRTIRVTAVAFSPDGKTLAVASADQTITLWNLATAKERAILRHRGAVNSVAFSPDGQTLASASADQTIKLWDPKTGKEQVTLKGHMGVVNSVVFSPNSQTLASAGADKTIRLWDGVSGQEKAILKGSANGMAFSPDSNTLASGSADQTIKLWNVATIKEPATLKGHLSWVRSVAFSPDGKTLASGSADQTIKLWDAATGIVLSTLKGHTGAVFSVAFSPDGQTLASASADQTIKLWDVKTAKERGNLQGHTGSVDSVAFSPDGKLLASGSGDQTIKLWDLATGKELIVLQGHTNRVTSVAFSPNGKTLASASVDQTIKLWDVATGKELATLRGHTGPLSAVAFSPDGKTLASASEDKTIKLWSVTTGSER